MHGIEAITAHNGWAMAVVGALIVLSGLTILSIIISQLHKIIMIIEHGTGMLPFNNNGGTKISGRGKNPAENPPDGDHVLSNIGNLLLFYRTATSDLGDDFDLRDLYSFFRKNDFPHPYLTIRTLRDESYLVPTRDNKFTWNL